MFYLDGFWIHQNGYKATIMTCKENYRCINNIREEGFEFYLVLQYVAYFYINIMKGQIRRDSPDTLIKYSRDWEYPWVLIKSKIQPKYRTLDCGSGYSPIPFIWSMFGAEVHAIDRDVMICSRFRYALYCFQAVILDIVRFSLDALRKVKEKQLMFAETKPKNFEGKNKFDANIKRANPRAMNLLVKGFHSLHSYIVRNKLRISRIWKSDFWGPIPHGILQRYSVNYQKANLTSLPYRDDNFDIVSCVSVLEHMSNEDQIQGIREMSRVLKKGGKLIITYDKSEKDLTNRFIKESGMTPTEIVYFIKPNKLYDNLYTKNAPDVIGICLVK